MYGGTGSHSLRLSQPEELPDRLESGTPNTTGICGLRAGITFVASKGCERIQRHEIALLQHVYDRLCQHPSMCFYTSRPCFDHTAPVLSLNIGDLPSEQLAEALNEHHIAVRAGLHCAPCAHRRFGTLEQGTVRLAPSVFSTLEEADYISKVFLKIGEKSLH